ncbi:MAG: hypothetical protein KDH88_17850 [Chromatiales bacterium]|nr:hypothetical protein [Chromatiales bacterium]
MEKFLDVSRAARMAGVTVAEIRRKVSDGSLEADEGRIRVSQLMDAYPDVHLGGFTMVDVVAQIRDDALRKGAADHDDEVKSVEGLLLTVKRLRKESAFYREECRRQRQVMRDLDGMLADLRTRLEARQRPFLDAVTQWLKKKNRSAHRL